MGRGLSRNTACVLATKVRIQYCHLQYQVEGMGSEAAGRIRLPERRMGDADAKVKRTGRPREGEAEWTGALLGERVGRVRRAEDGLLVTEARSW